MPISFSCDCGFKVRAPDSGAGKKGRCPSCRQTITVPTPDGYDADAGGPPDLMAITPPLAADDGAIPFADAGAVATPVLSRKTTRVPDAVAAKQWSPPTLARRAAATNVDGPAVGGVRRHLYWVLLLVLLPLGYSTLHHGAGEGKSIGDRIGEVAEADSQVRERLDTLPAHPSKHQIFAALPGDRLDGALLPEKTNTHWVFAGISAAGFLVAVLLLFPPGHVNVGSLVGVGAVTGTVGIVLLLAFQWLAFHMPLFRGTGMVTLALDLVWLIGQSYRMALGDHGFFLSFMGFTAGVGFCEEACKALPLVLIAGNRGFGSWRSAMLWGLVSGIGFGVSEGITYSVDYYNGVSGADAYLVRFVSCVGLHGIWAAAVGIAIYRHQEFFQRAEGFFDMLLYTLSAVIVPMVLHGLYDTLLKQDHDGYALVVALASFGWLAFQIERSERHPDVETHHGAFSPAR